MNTSKHSPFPLLLALLAFAAPLAAFPKTGTDAGATPSAQNKRVEDLAQNSSDAPPTSGAPKRKVEDLSFDAFPAAAAKREIKPRAVSDNVAAQLAARMPHYTPPPEPKPKAEEADADDNGELADLRETDRPKNKILRLPDYVVREKKSPVLRERDIHSATGLAALATRRYLSETAQALNRYTLPFLGNGAQAYALARYAEDERLRTIRDLNETASDLGQLQGAEITAPSTWNGVPTWGSSAPASRRSSDAEADLRRLIRDTTSHRATEPRSKLPQ